jgi:copper transport protein
MERWVGEHERRRASLTNEERSIDMSVISVQPARSGLPGLAVAALLMLAAACSPVPSTPPQAPVQTPVAQPQSTASPALPEATDLTLAQEAGRVLIGLTVRPARPGPNTLLLYVLPPDGPASALDVPLGVSIDGRAVAVDTCSRTCRTATLTLVGGEHVDVVAGGPAGGTAGFDLPTLPAPDGTALLQRVQDRMHRLRSYRVDETLGPASPPLQSRYAFEAPDRMRVDLGDGASTVWVGPTRYARDAASAPWRTETVDMGLTVPTFVWDASDAGGTYVGAHLVGTETVDGVQTQVLAFFMNAGQTVVWFRLWADGGGLVHRAAMRAQGHFMDHRYSDFDAHLVVEPPTR